MIARCLACGAGFTPATDASRKRSCLACWRRTKAQAATPPNQILTLTHCDGLLRFELSDHAYGCPARGVWVGDCKLSLWQFLAVPHWRLRGGRVELEQTLDSIRIGSHQTPICFAD